MKNIKPVMVLLAVASMIFTSCNKDAGIPENGPDNYDVLDVVNSSSNSLSVVNLATNQEEKTIILGSSGTMIGGGMIIRYK